MDIIGGRYKPSMLLGRGGMGDVYQATDTQTGLAVAIKVLKPEVITRDPDVVARFTREGEALRQLNHPNIVTILDTLQEGQTHYIVMELVGGGNLAELLMRQAQLPVKRVLEIALELSDALTRAHHLKIIHRDIKPANVLLAEDGTPRLTDFGIARIGESHLTEVGITLGTMAYLSPEACRGEPIDVRTDIWSFGVVLYEMLAGRRPFEGERPATMLHAILTKPLPPLEETRPNLPVALVDLVYRMLEKNIEARIPRMRMVGAELEAIIDGLDTKITGIRGHHDTPDVGNTLIATMTPSGMSSTARQLPPHNIPAFTTPFVGREREVAEVGELLTNSDSRLITLVGTGGIGKTRLAVATAEQHLAQFADGSFYVTLASLTKSDHIVTAIAESANFSFSGAEAPKTQLLNYLREKTLLLILDNYEHLMDSTGIVTDILRAAPDVKIVAISRERLRLQGEYVVEVGGLPVPHSDDDLAHSPAAQLFIQSAQRTQAEFALNEETAPCIARICQLVQGMPLGLELAAAWLEMVSIEEIVHEIEQSLDFLESNLRDVPERHRSIRAVFESSWSLLTEDERDAFVKLAVFKGGFTREAAQAVTGASLRSLTALVNKSLLQRAADGRYSPHMLLRQYAVEQFENLVDDPNAIYANHARYYAEFLAKQESKFNTKQEKTAVDAVELELENIRCAWDFAIAHHDWASLAKMLHPLYDFYAIRSLLQEAQQMFGGLADALEPIEQGELYWRAKMRYGTFVGRTGSYQTPLHIVEQALPYFQKHALPFEISFALNGISYVYMMIGRYAESSAKAGEALEIARRVGNMEIILFSMGNMGYAEYLHGNHARAREIYVEYNRLAAEASPISHAYGLNNLGEICHAMREVSSAEAYYEQALAIFRAFRHQQGIAFTLNNLGGIYFLKNQFDKAKRCYRESYGLHKNNGDHAGIGHSLSALGNVAMAEANYTEAKRYFEQSLSVRRETGDPRVIADSLYDLSIAHMGLQQLPQSTVFLEEALGIRREIGDQLGVAYTLMALTFATAFRGDVAQTLAFGQEAEQIEVATDNRFLQGWIQAGYGEVYFRTGDYERAAAYFYQTLRIAQKADASEQSMAVLGLLGIGTLEMVQNNPSRAVELITLAQLQEGDYVGIVRYKSTEYLKQLQKQLPTAEFEAVQARAATLDFATTIEEVLKSYAG